MILGEGLFQADGHPGNILVQSGGRIALLDYGQSKQLGEKDKRAFADLVLAMNRCVSRTSLIVLHISLSPAACCQQQLLLSNRQFPQLGQLNTILLPSSNV